MRGGSPAPELLDALREQFGRSEPDGVASDPAFDIADVRLTRHADGSLDVNLETTIWPVRSGTPSQRWEVVMSYGPEDDDWVKNPLGDGQIREAAFMIAVALDEWWSTRLSEQWDEIRARRVDP